MLTEHSNESFEFESESNSDLSLCDSELTSCNFEDSDNSGMEE